MSYYYPAMDCFVSQLHPINYAHVIDVLLELSSPQITEGIADMLTAFHLFQLGWPEMF